MIEKSPVDTLEYLQSRVEFVNQRSDIVDGIVNSLTPIGEPKILGRHFSHFSSRSTVLKEQIDTIISM